MLSALVCEGSLLPQYGILCLAEASPRTATVTEYLEVCSEHHRSRRGIDQKSIVESAVRL
jgi:hypothetical protein